MEALSTALKGLQLTLVPEIEAYWLENQRLSSTSDSQNGSTATTYLREKKFTPEQKPQRREQVGWIEERWGNKSRRKPAVSLYYCYYASEWELTGEGSRQHNRKQRIYLQCHQCQDITRMVREKRPYTDILKAIGNSKRHTAKPHHTKEPKI